MNEEISKKINGIQPKKGAHFYTFAVLQCFPCDASCASCRGPGPNQCSSCTGIAEAKTQKGNRRTDAYDSSVKSFHYRFL